MCLLLSTTSERGKALLLLLRCSEYLEGSVALWQLKYEGNTTPSIQQDINFVTVWVWVEVDVDHIPRPTPSYPPSPERIAGSSCNTQAFKPLRPNSLIPLI